MSASDSRELTFSFICPVYNEQEGLEMFHGRLTAVAAKLGEPYEVIYVNDGSSDESAAVVRRIQSTDKNVKYVEFSRNFGHQIAVTAGYDYACGKAVISLDSDCQHPPELITDLVARWREGFEVVYTVRKDTEGISAIRRGIGRLVYRCIKWASGNELTDQADFRLMDRKAVDALLRTREQARFVRGLVHWIGFRQFAVPYTAEKRTTGRSNYSLKQLVNMSTAGMYNFSHRPLKAAPVIGAMLLLVVAAYIVAAVVLAVLGRALSPMMHLAMGMVALFGLQFLMLGLMGEYVARIFDEAKNRPLYIVRQTTGFESPEKPEVLTPPGQATQDKTRPQRFVLYT